MEAVGPHEPEGLQRFVVPPEFGSRPNTRFEGCVARRRRAEGSFIGLRLLVGGHVCASMVVDDWWEWAQVAVAKREQGAGIIDHIRSPDVEAVDDWISWFRQRLCGPMSPLYPGLWELYVPANPPLKDRGRPGIALLREPGPVVPSGEPKAVAGARGVNVYETNCADEVLPMRAASALESGRVKWWRKVARQGKLPPILVQYVFPLLGFVVLDGHDRLLAAALEEVEPSFVVLTSLRRRELPDKSEARQVVGEALREQLAKSPDSRTVDSVNRALITLYEDHYTECTQRVWPIAGGLEGWSADLEGFEPGNESAAEVLADMRASLP